MNSITLDGTAYKPEYRTTRTGKGMITFDLGFYQGKGTDGKSEYGYIRVKAFGDLADNAQTIKDRDKVVVAGRLAIEKWEKDGQKYSMPCLLASDLGMAINKFSSQSSEGNQTAYGTTVEYDEEIPF